MEWYLIMSYIAAVVLPVAFIPQAKAIYKSKDTTGISPISYFLVFIGTIFLMLWGGLSGVEKGIGLYVSEFVLTFIEFVIMFYLYKNVGKPWIFYLSIPLFIAAAGVGLPNLIHLGTFKLSQTWMSIIISIGIFSIAFAFAPQTTMSLIKKDVGNVNIITSSLIALGNLLLFMFYIGLYKAFGEMDAIFGIIGSVIGMSWQLPQIGLKIYLDHKKK